MPNDWWHHVERQAYQEPRQKVPPMFTNYFVMNVAMVVAVMKTLQVQVAFVKPLRKTCMFCSEWSLAHSM